MSETRVYARNSLYATSTVVPISLSMQYNRLKLQYFYNEIINDYI